MGFALVACEGPADLPAPRPGPGELVVRGDRFQVGFGAKVSLEARVVGGDDAGRGEAPWTVAWRQVWGPKAVITRNEGGVLELVTPQLPTNVAGEAAPGALVPLSAARAGRMVFVAEASSKGIAPRSRTVEVIPAFPSASWPRVALGVVAYLPVRAGAAWTVTEGAIERVGTGATDLAGIASSTAGWHELQLEGGGGGSGSGKMRLRSGAWLGSLDCGRGDCHPREYRGWLATGHATIFTRGLTGELVATRGRYRGDCIACHTLGYQPGVENGGFDDVAEELGWVFPERPSAEAWAALPVALRERANVQCEHCHGPGWFWVGYGDDICAQCHDHPPEYPIPSRWRSSAMSRAQRSVEGYGPDLSCGTCHVASEFIGSVLGHRSTSDPGTELETIPRGVGCPVCHDSHGSGCDHQVRVCGAVEIPGLTYEAGQGALCVLCHSGDADVFGGAFPRPFAPGAGRPGGGGHGDDPASYTVDPDTAPHAGQALVVSGRGGRFLELTKTGGARYTGYPHLWVEDGCVGCHSAVSDRRLAPMDHLFRIAEGAGQGTRSCWADLDLDAIAGSPRTRSCAPCHGSIETLDVRARGDYDGDGGVEGLVSEVDGLMSILRGEIEAQLGAASISGADGREGATITIEREKMVVADRACVPLRSDDGGPVPVSRLDPALSKAVYNYLLVSRDGSGGIHNPQYVVRLVQDTIRGLEKARGARGVHGWRALGEP
jgi:hypothetical protein